MFSNGPVDCLEYRHSIAHKTEFMDFGVELSVGNQITHVCIKFTPKTILFILDGQIIYNKILKKKKR